MSSRKPPRGQGRKFPAEPQGKGSWQGQEKFFKATKGVKSARRTRSGAWEILFGIHSVLEALRAGRRKIQKIHVADTRSQGRLSGIIALAEKRKIPVQECSAEDLTDLTDSTMHQGVAAMAENFPVHSGLELLDVIEKNNQKQKPCFFLVLESIEDPHNLGALIRSAVCAGVDGILIPKHRSALPNPTVSRISAGAMEHANIFVMTNASAVLRQLQEKGVWIMGLDACGTGTLYDADLTMPLALVVGGEHKGLRPGVHKLCQEILSIPMEGQINSLNASVAGAIALFEVIRQRSVSSI